MDLNLLVGLDALLEHRSVQDAAAQLHLTQPAVSRILGRLRATTGDAILVRNGREMVPTARALELREEVRELVTRAHDVLRPAEELDLATLERTFTVRSHDALLAALAPGLVAAVAERAPHVTLRLVGESRDDDRELSRGGVDIAVDCPSAPAGSIVSRVVGTDDMVLVLRRGNAVDVARPTAAQVAGAPHVVVSRRGRSGGPVDRVLQAEGLTRRVVATVPTVAAALAVVATSEAVVVLPRRLRDPLGPRLRTRPLPWKLSSEVAAVSWHRRHTTDPAHAWLRDLVAATLEAALSGAHRAVATMAGETAAGRSAGGQKPIGRPA
ncbi:LysR family transcriptional regulator [Actinoplanes sp. NBRC 103695]|uniref:LysR family transcriptional regulator n=1 Tax=Actinoplanes sp. NBRC 103695 TaxID=3032202 RepID=UPI0025537A6C|nr:LysR family transcriptional regulator [Actinoplanes sp. NBRC 103695]